MSANVKIGNDILNNATAVKLESADTPGTYVTFTEDRGFDVSKFNSRLQYVTLNGYIASGFTGATHYIEAYDPNNANRFLFSNKFEIKIKAQYTQTLNRSMVLLGASGSNFYKAPTIEFSGNGAGIYTAVSSNETSWTDPISFSSSEITMAPNKWYTVILTYDGVNYTASVTVDGNTVTKQRAVTSLFSVNGTSVELGGIASSSGHYATYVNIDLSECYIKTKNILRWGIVQNL